MHAAYLAGLDHPSHAHGNEDGIVVARALLQGVVNQDSGVA